MNNRLLSAESSWAKRMQADGFKVQKTNKQTSENATSRKLIFRKKGDGETFHNSTPQGTPHHQTDPSRNI